MLESSRFPARLLMCAAALALAASCERSVVLTPRVGSVEIVDPPASLPLGEIVTLNAVVRDASGELLQDRKVYWGTLDSTIVQVDSVTGIARAHNPGTTQIVASSEDKRQLLSIVVPPGALVAFNTFVTDDLSPADDVDEFTFPGTAGQQVNLLLQGLSGLPEHQFRLRVLGPGGNPLDSVTSRGNDLSKRGQAIKWLQLPQAGTYRVRVDATLGGAKGAYQFMVETIKPAPEKVPAAVSPGDSITAEALTPGDIDDFTYMGTAGEELSILFQAQSHSPSDALRVRLLAPGGAEVVFVQSNGDYPTRQPSGRLKLTLNGQYTLRVQGVDAEDQGPYLLQVVRINRKPEQVTDTLTSDKVVTETIAPPGDVDEFLFRVAAQREVNVYLQSLGAPGDSLMLRVLRPDSTVRDSVRSPGADPALEGRGIGYLSLSPATYRIQVEGGKRTQGGYKFLVRSINLAPEGGAKPAYTLGTTVSTETILPVGDVDEFTFTADSGNVLRIVFRATSGSANDVLRLYLVLPNGFDLLYASATGDQLDQTYETTLPQSGTYRIRVRGLNSNDDSGPYRFQILKIH
jgi:hypothetical protein